MNKLKLITALLLLQPGLSWALFPPPVTAPEPGMLALLGVGGVVAVVVTYFRRKK